MRKDVNIVVDWSREGKIGLGFDNRVQIIKKLLHNEGEKGIY